MEGDLELQPGWRGCAHRCMHGWGILLASKVVSVGITLVPAGVHVFMPRGCWQGREMTLASSFSTGEFFQ